MSLLGILLNPLSAGDLWTLTPENTDSYTINNNLPDGTPISIIQDIEWHLGNKVANDPAVYSEFNTNLGTVWLIPGSALLDMTTLTIDPWSGPPNHGQGSVIVTEDNSTNPSTFKLEQVVATPYSGAPLVSNVYAQQVAGSKNVVIDFSLLLQSDDSGGYPPSDKASHLEFWFKSNPTSLQWEECMMFETPGAPGGGVGNQKEPGPINESGVFFALWKAGDQKPNFQTSTGKIRVMVTYNHEDPNNPGTTIQGSGWDGYEAENGPTFTLDGGNPMINYNNSEYMFFQEIDTNNIARAGSLNYNGNLYPVFQLTSVMLQNLTGTGGIPDGKYAFGGAPDYLGGPVSLKIIPVN
jgi:hypothetical protein